MAQEDSPFSHDERAAMRRHEDQREPGQGKTRWFRWVVEAKSPSPQNLPNLLNLIHKNTRFLCHLFRN